MKLWDRERWTASQDSKALTRIVASDSCSTPKGLPQQGGVLPAVLHEHFLQSLRPVQLIQNDWGCERRRQGQS